MVNNLWIRPSTVIDFTILLIISFCLTRIKNMISQILETELLTELSEQQQQMIAGGLQSIMKNVHTFYNTDAVAFLNQNGSGPGGSFVNTGIKQAQLNTGSSELLKVKFD